MLAVKIRNIELGTGIPKICVPLTGKTAPEIEAELHRMKEGTFDLIEWRADKFEALQNLTELSAAAFMIRKAFPEKPLIFTIRTKNDMEDFEISDSVYRNINLSVSEHRLADLIDLEFSRGAEFVRDFIRTARPHGTKFICSCHLKNSTPSVEEMLRILFSMAETGSDLVKLAVLPQSKRDVLDLMDATLRFSESGCNTPVITMSMGKTGVLSRISGSLTGSCLTFGTIGAASAPGQPECGRLAGILDLLGTD